MAKYKLKELIEAFHLNYQGELFYPLVDKWVENNFPSWLIKYYRGYVIDRHSNEARLEFAFSCEQETSFILNDYYIILEKDGLDYLLTRSFENIFELVEGEE